MRLAVNLHTCCFSFLHVSAHSIIHMSFTSHEQVNGIVLYSAPNLSLQKSFRVRTLYHPPITKISSLTQIPLVSFSLQLQATDTGKIC